LLCALTLRAALREPEGARAQGPIAAIAPASEQPREPAAA
jgi:hypothetical protein